MLACIDERLRQLRGVNKPFGGVTVLCFGDLMQLKPVSDGNVFEPANCDPFGNIIGSRWSNFSFFELTEIMRQKEKSWCELLNRLRFAELTLEDIRRLNCLVDKDIPKGTPWACRKLNNVRKHNHQVLLQHEGLKHSVVALDKAKGELSESKEICDTLLSVAKQMTENFTCGLAYCLVLSVGLPYMITNNVDKEDGLVNGAVGDLLDLSFMLSEVVVLWLYFSDKSVGCKARNRIKGKYTKQVSNGLTPIFKVVRSFRVKNNLGQLSNLIVERLQFPCVQASALSIHKYQGKTAHGGLAIDFESYSAVESLHYTGLSRCPSEQGNYIISDLYAHQIKANEKVKKEMVRLKNEACMIFTLPFEKLEDQSFKALFHNVESFRKYFHVIEKMIVYKRCTLLVFAETRLLSDDSESYTISGYKQYRYDWPFGHRIPAGLILYIDSSCTATVENVVVGSTQMLKVILA